MATDNYDYVGGDQVPGGDASNDQYSGTLITLTDGRATITGTAGYSSDEQDSYTFVADSSDTLSAVLSDLTGTVFLRLFEIDSAGNTLRDVDLSADDSDKSVSYDVVAGRTYTLLVDPYSTYESGYKLSVSLGNAGDDGDTGDGSSGGVDYDSDLYSDFVNDQVVSGGDASDNEDDGTLIELDNGHAAITGTTGYGSDEQDSYTFVADSSGSLSAVLSGLTGTVSLRLYGIDSGDSTLLDVDLSADDSDKSVSYDVVAGQAYTLLVDPYSTYESGYHLDLDITGGEEPPLDNYNDYVDSSVVTGDDAGGSLTSATEIDWAGDQVSISGSAGYNNDAQDWYRFVAPAAADQLTTAISGLQDSLSITLYDSDQVVVWATETGNVEDKIALLTAGETYYLSLDSDSQEVSSFYQIVLSTAAVENPDTVNGGLVAGGDAGDSLADAVDVTADEEGLVTISGMSGVGSDNQDWYRFEALFTGIADIELSGFDEDLYIYLMDGDGNEIAGQKTSAADGDTHILTPEVEAGETYIVGVHPGGTFYTAESVYDLQIDLGVTGGFDLVNGEPLDGRDAGNSAASAAAVDLAVGQTLIEGNVGTGDDDLDYYQLSLPATAGTMSLHIADFAGTLLVEIDGQQLTLESGEFAFSGGEEFIVWIEPAGGGTDYALTFGVELDPLPNEDSVNGAAVTDGDAANTVAGGVLVDLTGGDAAIAGSVANGEDLADYYLVTLPDGPGSVTLDLTSFNAVLSVDFDGQLFALPNQLNTFNLDGETYNLVVQPGVEGVTDYGFLLDVDIANIDPGSDAVNGVMVSGGDAAADFAGAAALTFDANGHADIVGATGFSGDAGDCYGFTAIDSGVLQMSMTGLDQALSAQLYTLAGALVNNTLPNGTADATFSASVSAGESYVLVVDPFLGAESIYTLGLDMA